jgi:small-conductance mechanosensitive channel
MSENMNIGAILKKLLWHDALLVLTVFVLARLLMISVQWLIRWLSEKVSPRLRLSLLRIIPIVRLLIVIAAAAVIVPILVEPTFRNIVTILVSVSLALAFELKDYGSSFIAGWVTVLENTYQPGDWIEVDGAYGEVKSIRARATRILTADDTEVVIPHSHLWSKNIFNATSGNRSLLCVTDFYLHPDHDAAAARKRLAEIVETSVLRKPDSPVTVIVLEKPWGTHYRVKGYAQESREQFLFMTDVTVRSKEAIRSLGIRFAQVPYTTAKS